MLINEKACFTMPEVTGNTVSFSDAYPTPPDLPTPQINDSTLPLVSIVIPSYNQGRFIHASIDSVLGQDYPNIEVWVVDGGSTDETLSVLQDFVDHPSFHYLSEKDTGQSDAINKGLARCQGRIFSWLCSDDLLDEHALHFVVDAWRNHTAPCIVYGRARLIDEFGYDLGPCPLHSSTMTLDKVLTFGKYNVVQPATFVPIDTVRAVGGIDRSLHFSMDLALWIELAQRLPFVFVDYNLALYRLHAASKTVAGAATKSIDDVRVLAGRAVDRSLLAPKLAQGRVDLFAARMHLLPENKRWRTAAAHLGNAIRADYTNVPEAVLIVVKAMIRTILRERFWMKVRAVQSRMY